MKTSKPSVSGYKLVLKDKLFQSFITERNIRHSTSKGYASALARYKQVVGFKELQELIDEALEDERKRIPTKETRLAEHLREFQAYLNKNIGSSRSVNTYFSKVETFYRHYNITIPHRAPMTNKPDYVVNYFDLPDKKMISIAIDQSPLWLKSMIYFMSSSGTANAETLGLTIGKFVDGFYDYTETSDPEKFLEEMYEKHEPRRDLVPCISMMRRKTNVPYFTCCSPEASYYILKYMKSLDSLERGNNLWDIQGSKVLNSFQDLNDANNWGRVGPYRRFRTHTLRKYHASNLGCSFEIINTLEGRTNGDIHETYCKQRPDEIKRVYMEHMSNVMINPELFIGPNCGRQSKEGEIQQAIVDLIPELSDRLPSDVVAKAPENTTHNVMTQSEQATNILPQAVPAGTTIHITGPVNIINLDNELIQNIDNTKVQMLLKELTGSNDIKKVM